MSSQSCLRATKKDLLSLPVPLSWCTLMLLCLILHRAPNSSAILLISTTRSCHSRGNNESTQINYPLGDGVGYHRNHGPLQMTRAMRYFDMPLNSQRKQKRQYLHEKWKRIGRGGDNYSITTRTMVGDDSYAVDKSNNERSDNTEKTSKSSKAMTKDVSYSYYLLWSPGAARKVMISTLFIALCHFASVQRGVVKQFFVVPTAMKNFIYNIVLPLLSSACCFLQLVLNIIATGGGCAGFNTYLGPLRPYFLSLLAYVTILSSRGSKIVSTAWLARWLVALLPEIVYLWNSQRQRWWRSRKQPTYTFEKHVKLQLDIPSMGCVACINKIDSALANCGQVKEMRSWLQPVEGNTKGGKASILLSVRSDENLDAIIESLVSSVSDAGFPCEVDDDIQEIS